MQSVQEDAKTDASPSTGQLPGGVGAPFTDEPRTEMYSVVQRAGGDDADSDISMSSESSSDSDESDNDSDAPVLAADFEAQRTYSGLEVVQGGLEMASKKRKSPASEAGGSERGGPQTTETRKKARHDPEVQSDKGTASDKSLLAPEVWHHIFTFCPPKTLGNLLSVNKLFHQYLNPSSSEQDDYPPSTLGGVLSTLKPHDIWQSSRRLFWPRMPAPLRSMSELNMWRLLCSTKCQECSKSSAGSSETAADNVHNGPGAEGVTLIWPFGVRVCGPCLLAIGVKEIDVLLSSTVPSSLIPALPFVHITKDLHAVSLRTIEQDLLPANVQVTKLFLASDVQEIKQEFISVKSLGSGTMEEWLKGLEPRGQARTSEYRKWEKWATTGSLEQVRQVTDPYAREGNMTSQPTTAMAAPKTDHQQLATPARRTLEEVALLKAARRAEIERRASRLDPPLAYNVLRHMVSFEAAIQLISALDDDAWNLLKPRLLAERSEAEKVEDGASAQSLMPHGQDSRNSHLEATLATTKEAKDAVDRDWEEVQAPLRVKIVRYVDEFIRDSWDKGKKVKQDNCSRFAAEALIHVRKRFYAQVAEAAEAARAAGKEPATDPAEGPFLHKLTLENMRWIFDSKIKPLTAPFKKEVFFCNGCAAKPFGFEGVVQHYAAKHTDKLSSGNVVVYWRAEWPEVPPFNPEGRMKVIHPAAGSTPHLPGTVAPPTYPFSSYAPPPGRGVTAPPQSLAPGLPFGASPYAGQYGHQYATYPPNYAPPTPGLPPAPYAQPQHGWPPYPAGPTPPQVAGYHPQMPTPGSVPAPPTGPGPYNYGPGGYAPSQAPYPVQLDDIVRNSREIWNATANIHDLPGSVRIFVTIHHVVKRFIARFSLTPALAIFKDGLSDHKDMRPVRNINGLACKVCQLGLGNAPYIPKDRDTYSLPQLVNHFHSQHVEAITKDVPGAPPLDWIHDMILLPAPAVLARLPGSVGSDAFKYRLFSEAFPEVFGQPPAVPPPNTYGQQVQQHMPYPHQPQYEPAAPPTPVEHQQQSYPQQQGPHQVHQIQADHATNGQLYQPQPVYSQTSGTSAPGYIPPHGQGPAYRPDQAPLNPAFSSVAENDVSGREENSSRSSHGSWQRTQQQKNAKWTRKDKKRHAQNSHGAQNKHARSKEEEPRLPDEEKAREEELRAMWANDRVVTARALQPSETPTAKEGPRQNQAQVQAAAKESKNELQQDTRSVAPQGTGHIHEEGSSLLDALEMHLDQGHRPISQSQPHRTDQDGTGHNDGSPPRPTVTEALGGRPDEYHASATSGRRELSPAVQYAGHAREEHPQKRGPAVRQYIDYYPEEAVPTRPAPGEIRYQTRDQRPPPQHHDAAPHHRPEPYQPYDRDFQPAEQVIYEHAPQDHRYRSSYPEELIPPPPRGPPTGQLYEIVEVIDAQGSYFIRRPIGRAPPAEAVYYDYPPYEHDERARERQPPHAVAAASRGLPEPYLAPHHSAGRDDGYSRPAPYPPAPPAQQHHRHEHNDPYPPAPSTRGWAAGDYPPQQYHRSPPGPRPELQRAWGGGHGAPQQEEEEEEYDPRFPAGSPPGPAAPAAPAGRSAPGGYQRRQVRYD